VLGIERRHEIAVKWSAADEAIVRSGLPFDPAQQAFAVLHVYPKFNYKMWSREGWIALVQHLSAQGLQLVLSGSGEPAERDYIGSLAAALPAATVNLSGALPLSALAWLLSRARLYVGPDTAITHMAAALGIPTIALYGPTDPVKWGPWPKGHAGPGNPWQRHGSQTLGNVRLIQGAGGCVPCLLEGCLRRIDSFSDCLQSLPASRIITAADELLQYSGYKS
jgi:heptosyltransferase-3